MITPERISSLIHFNAQVEGWTYRPDGTDMYSLQAQGAARIYNILKEQQLALLADEVGMGKTIQALAVCAALWHENPQARILVLAPRDEIVSNWEREYQTFIRHHYKHEDDIVKSQTGHVPVKTLIRCANLYDLIKEIQSGWGHFFIAKISSFSHLMSGEDIFNRLEELGIKNQTRLKNLKGSSGENGHLLNGEIARLLKNEIVRLTDGNKPYFDLLIIDEAHYFRHKNGDSLRVQTAMEFFGRPETSDFRPLAKKVLLMTATPNHSSSADIGKIVSYFTEKYNNREPARILEQLCVRRLRRLGTGSHNKYTYRHEQAPESDFRNNPLGEMFFALYQHELAKQFREQQSASGGRTVSRMMKYLEGVEFIPFRKEQAEEQEQDDAGRLSTDYNSGSDATLLHDLSNKFKEIFLDPPVHPKYEKLVADLTHRHNGEKSVVFVRRIPSVFEISKRIMDYYDRKLWEQMQHGDYAELGFDKLNRKNFRHHSPSEATEQHESDNEQQHSESEKLNIPTSRVLNLFKTSKSDAIRSTDASNFRLRFTRSKPDIFTMFFCPGQDYFSAPYVGLISYKYDMGHRELDNYFNSALMHRTQLLSSEKGIEQDIKSVLLSRQPMVADAVERPEVINTLFTIFWEVFLNDTNVPYSYRNEVSAIYRNFDYYEKEAFSAFIEKATLFASEALVWFFECYRAVRTYDPGKPIDTYLKFCTRVRNELAERKLYRQIQESILQFKNIYTKVFSIQSRLKLLEENWDSFDNAQPVYPYNADNSSKKVLSCFNTPFYPDILIATSVLQEGVNLQYFCNTVYHYGMAWTPGDNEQRIGRIDRMFGKIERLLDEQSEEAQLNIYYPYLKDTIDEEQLRRFIKRKHAEETLIDRGMSGDSLGDFNYFENDNEDWKKFLRQPEQNEKKDPFPVDLGTFTGSSPKAIKPMETTSLQPIFHSIINALQQVEEIDLDCYFIEKGETPRILVDPSLNGSRRQPVVVEFVFDPIGSGLMKQPVYCLQFKTPLASNKKLKELISGRFYENAAIQRLYKPGLKLCLDPGNSSGANWGIYMSVELPVYLHRLDMNPLSQSEIRSSFLNLVYCADKTESEIFNKDLRREELNISVRDAVASDKFQLRGTLRSSRAEKWEPADGYLVLQNNFKLPATKELEKNSFILNHEHLFIKSYVSDGRLLHHVSYPADDAQSDELAVLEHHWNVFVRKKT